MIIKNEDIREVVLEVPEGHEHIRTTIQLNDGSELVFQEASMANLVRAYITIKTHPTRTGLKLKCVRLTDKKAGYADWQLVEVGE